MMTKKNKLNVGALPDQTDDYSHFEESGLRWDRIAIVIVLAVVIIAVPSTWLDEEETSSVLSSNKAEQSQTVNTAAVLPQKVPPPAAQEAIDEAETKQPPALPDEESVPEKQAVIAALAPHSKPAVEGVTSDLQKASPVAILNSGITKAQLSIIDDDGQPFDIQEPVIPIAGQNVIKVVLSTEMKGLRGHVLYHDWYRNGIRQARVKIPVNVSPQNSSSSKYINRQMLGAWQVGIVDEQGAGYLKADFNVVSE